MAELIINTICLTVLVILEIIFYLILAGKVLPQIVRFRYSLSESRDRGIKKYVYPDGRGITYEPRPAMRKYMPRYILFTNNGYKYVKCLLDSGVNSVGYTVVMFNNLNRVIDIIDVKSERTLNNETMALLVHGDTSYVDISIFSVNGMMFEKENIAYCKVRDLFTYTAAMSLLCFVELVIVQKILNLYFSWWTRGILWADIGIGYLLLFAVFIGVLCGAMAFLKVRSKKIRWAK